jgi:hypothetical protein
MLSVGPGRVVMDSASAFRYNGDAVSILHHLPSGAPMNHTALHALVLTGALALGCVALHPAIAQTAAAPGATEAEQPAIPAARPADVASMDAIIAAVYDVISGPKGQKRDWERMRSLFVPGARLIPAHTDASGTTKTSTLSVDDYIRRATPALEGQGFFERETHRTVERFGAIAQVFSTYDSRHAATDAEPFQRGINSFQLLFDGQRWWVVNIYWQAASAELPIPKQYGG